MITKLCGLQGIVFIGFFLYLKGFRAVTRQGNLGSVCALLQAIFGVFGVIIDFGDLQDVPRF